MDNTAKNMRQAQKIADAESTPPASVDAVPGGHLPLPPSKRRRPPPPTMQERYDRRKSMRQLVANNVDLETVVVQMQRRYAMKRHQVKQLHAAVRAEFIELDRESVPLLRAAQLERLQGHIIAAKAANAFGAVAQFERTYASVSGTLQPTQLNISVDATLREAVTHVLATLTPEQIAGLAGEPPAPLQSTAPQTSPLQSTAPQPAQSTAPRATVDTQGTPVPDAAE